MAITLEDLAARVEELVREKACADQQAAATAQHVAALEQEVVTLRATLAERSLLAPEAPQDGQDAGRAPRALTRLGLLGAAAAAGAYALRPAGAQAQTLVSPQAPITSPNGLFSLNVTNAGIFLTGPAGRIELLLGQVIVKSAGATTIDGAVVNLNSGGKPVARVGDQVAVTVNTPSGPGAGTGTILPPGAVNVLA